MSFNREMLCPNSPGEIGIIADGSAKTRHLIGVLVFWLASGIVEVSLSKRDFVLKRTGSLPANAPSFEVDLFNILFDEHETSVSMEDLRGFFYKRFNHSLHELDQYSHQNRYFSKFSILRRFFFKFFAIMLALFGSLYLVITGNSGTIAYLLLLSSVLMMIGMIPARRTKNGQELFCRMQELQFRLGNSQTTAAREFLLTDEKHVYRGLAFAIVLGKENDWLRACEAMYPRSELGIPLVEFPRFIRAAKRSFSTPVSPASFVASLFLSQ